MATCVDLAAAQFPTQFNGHTIIPLAGQSLKPLLTGEGKFAERELYWEHEGNAAIRTGDRKLVREGASGKWQLFDLASDRTEQNDLADREPSQVTELTARWTQWANGAQVFPKPDETKKKNNNKKKNKAKNK